ncbi:hypothetical protein LFM09_09850 [Lentzea alba]|uniref:hypothetical protein n=1 Tax=Lentzea alba TaxID=2714351 RepID=UPI0039BED662
MAVAQLPDLLDLLRCRPQQGDDVAEAAQVVVPADVLVADADELDDEVWLGRGSQVLAQVDRDDLASFVWLRQVHEDSRT